MSTFLGRLGIRLARLAKFELAGVRIPADTAILEALFIVPPSLVTFAPQASPPFAAPASTFVFLA